ncbi:MAG: hypothetical protein K0S32_2441 [Bacteroidetes bacterium]|jgi:hypothetical protein|nr:hypothetical protein [Bacteroidota bacterium]
MQDEENLYWILAKISALSCLIPFLIGLICIKKIKTLVWPVFILICFSVLTETLNYVTMKMEMKNEFIYHIFTILEFSSIMFFYVMFLKPFVHKWIILGMIPLFLIVAYIDFRINGLDEMNSFAVSIESIFLSVFSLISFFIVMQKMLYANILATSFFWINTGILLYFSGNFLLFLFSKYLYISKEANFEGMYAIHSFVNISYNLLISIGFWKTRAQ